MNNLKLKFMKYIYCPIIGHDWFIYYCRYRQLFGGWDAYYEGKCLQCAAKKDALLGEFQRTGLVIFAEKMERNTIPD